MTKTSLELLEDAYISLLRLPFGGWRLKNQATLSSLRDEIATLTGKDCVDVQDHYEYEAFKLNNK